ncbi:MAG: phytanoyl-CoA dioxygenase family protein [Planctomycetes bacterium]|nr:phytanoyl-CoA dioxygenase family protein [Planctomycetota bacterium]
MYDELLNAPYEVSEQNISHFVKHGFVHLKKVLDPQILAHYDPILRASVEEQNTAEALEDRDLYGKAFLQIMNIWRYNSEVIPFILNQRLARIAAELLEVSGVRMYHDQALYKEPNGGITPWHTDQRYWPLASEKSITAWIPLQDTPMQMGPLQYAYGSQHILENRMLAISEESEEKIDKMVKLSDLEVYRQPFELGDVGFHYGYTFHQAGVNNSDSMRGVQTIIYIDKDMRLDACKRTQGDADAWCPGVAQGDIIDSELNPILWEQ